jgi:hypothetical protein
MSEREFFRVLYPDVKVIKKSQLLLRMGAGDIEDDDCKKGYILNGPHG